MAKLDKIKEFAEKNYDRYNETGDPEQAFGVESEKYAMKCIYPWADPSGRFPLNDEQAVKTWGLPLVLEYCEKASELISA